MSVNNSTFDSNVYKLIKEGLDASSLRSKVSANNIANVNTKGYKARSVSFEDTLKDNIDSLELKTTDDRHIKDGSGAGEITVKVNNSSSISADGNNVDIENEMVNQAANSLMFNAMVTQINNKLSQTNYVINGGK